MSVEANTAIIEHLGRQHQAMVALLAELVSIDSGSYNKRGVDAVQDRLRAWLDAAGIACEMFPNERFGGCVAAAATGRSCCWAIATRCFPTARSRSGRSASTATGPRVRGSPT